MTGVQRALPAPRPDPWPPTPLLLLLALALAAVCGEEGGPDREPEFLSSPSNITVRQGGMAVLPCSILYLGTKQVAWRRLGEEHFITIGKTTWVKDSNVGVEYQQQTSEITDWNLIIKNVRPSQAGTYECQITATEVYRRKVHLNVIGPPINNPGISLTGKEYVELGDPITLTCNATGGTQTPEEIDWFKDGDKVDSGKYQNIEVTKRLVIEHRALISELHIRRAKMQDKGTYICRSSEDKIDRIEVTVLHADSVQVKRGTATERSAAERSGAGRRGGHHSWPLLALLAWTLRHSLAPL